MTSKCQVGAWKDPGHHSGRCKKKIEIKLNWQPSGRGSFYAPVEILVCEAHRWLLDEHTNAWPQHD